ANVLGQEASIRPAGWKTFDYAPRMVDFEEFWILILEKAKMVKWNPETQAFTSGKMSLEKLETILPGLKRHGVLDLSKRQPTIVLPPKSGALWDRLRGFLNFPVVPA